MKLFPYSLLLSLFLWPSVSLAAPPAPWLAVAEARNLPFSLSSCLSAARATFNDQGFARVSVLGSSVMAAYQSGEDYQFKAVMRCQPHAATVVAMVVTTVSGAGTQRAQSLINDMRQQYQMSRSGGSVVAADKADAAEAMEDEDLLDEDFADDYVGDE